MREIRTVEDLAQFIFVDNFNDTPIDMTIREGCKSSKDLFFVCVELLSKGLGLLYGDDENKVDITTLTYEQINYAKRKLRLAKLDFKITITPIQELAKFHLIVKENNRSNCDANATDATDATDTTYTLLASDAFADDGDDLPEDLQLSEYCFKLQSISDIYSVNFDFF